MTNEMPCPACGAAVSGLGHTVGRATRTIQIPGDGTEAAESASHSTETVPCPRVWETTHARDGNQRALAARRLGRDVLSDRVRRVTVERMPGAVVTPRRARVGVPGRVLHDMKRCA